MFDDRRKMKVGEKSVRLTWIDGWRGLLILLVILGHSIMNVIGNDAANSNRLWCGIYSFHMPAFMAVSGYLNYHAKSLGGANLCRLILKRFKQIMIPYFIWSAILLSVKGQLFQLEKCILDPQSTYWFLWALFFITLLFYLIGWMAERLMMNRDLMLSICGLGFVVLMAVTGSMKLFGIVYILYYYLFYVLGYFLHKFDVIMKAPAWLGWCLLLFWMVLAGFWSPIGLPVVLTELIPVPASLSYSAYRLITATAAIVSGMVLFRSYFHYNSSNIIITFGLVSLGIYTVHMVIIGFIAHGLIASGVAVWACVIVTFLLAVGLSLGIVELLSKNKMTNKCLLGKF